MKTVALITQKNKTKSAQWQFDQVMAAIAYDLDLTIVFVNQGITQLRHNRAWKCLTLYGIDSIYVLYENDTINKSSLIPANEINMSELKQMISEARLIL